jgi:hypothetical protein
MSIAALRDENERLKALLAQTQAALSEHQGALAASEEARRRLEVILGELRREKFGAKSEKLRPDQYHLPLEDVEIAQGILDAAQERAEAVIQADRGVRRIKTPIAIAAACRPICLGWNGSSSLRARSVRAVAAP